MSWSFRFKIFIVVVATTTASIVMTTLLFNHMRNNPVIYQVNLNTSTLTTDASDHTSNHTNINISSDFITMLKPLTENLDLRESPMAQSSYRSSHNVPAKETQRNHLVEETPAVLTQSRSVQAFLSQPIINNHNFRYIHNPQNACTDARTDVLVAVPSAPGNCEKRRKVRESSKGDYAREPGNRARLLFFVGKGNSSEQEMIDSEVKRYGDITQEAFDDVYKNIRLKAVSMLKWASQYCHSAEFVIRTDDDVRVNLTELVSTLRRTALRHENFILGRVKVEDDPARDPRSKYFLSRAEFPDKKLPRYALGGTLGYPMRTVTLLYEAALRTRPIWLDDVYITGICAPKVGAELLSDPGFDFTHVSG